MKRKQKLKTWLRLVHMLKRATGKLMLPDAFHQAAEMLAFKGLHPRIFDGAMDIRVIQFCPKMGESGFKGVYFGTFAGREEKKYPEDVQDWGVYGVFGGLASMAFPDDAPELWVVLHEIGHWLDDVYFSRSFHHFKYAQCRSERIQQFVRLRCAMQREFEAAHLAALAHVSDEDKEHRGWYNLVPWDKLGDRAPTRYGLLNFSEWIAESFRQFYLVDEEWLAKRCPATCEFLSYALAGEVFRGERTEEKSRIEIWMEEDVSYAAVPALTYSGKGSEVPDQRSLGRHPEVGHADEGRARSEECVRSLYRSFLRGVS
jgi:hypothetical protein